METVVERIIRLILAAPVLDDRQKDVLKLDIIMANNAYELERAAYSAYAAIAARKLRPDELERVYRYLGEVLGRVRSEQGRGYLTYSKIYVSDGVDDRPVVAKSATGKDTGEGG